MEYLSEVQSFFGVVTSQQPAFTSLKAVLQQLPARYILCILYSMVVCSGIVMQPCDEVSFSFRSLGLARRLLDARLLHRQPS